MEQIFRKDGKAWVSQDFGVIGNAGEVTAWMKANHPEYRVGFKASDIGANVAAECKRQGFGDVLWMK